MNRLFAMISTKVGRALKQGWTPEAVCWSAAWGCTIGVFPIYGVTTITLALIGSIWKLNHSLLQAFNYLIAPLKLLLIIPYIRLGEFIFHAQNPFTLSISEFTLRFQEAPMATVGEFAMTFLHAVVGWLLTLPLWVLGVYFASSILMRAGEKTKQYYQEEVKS